MNPWFIAFVVNWVLASVVIVAMRHRYKSRIKALETNNLTQRELNQLLNNQLCDVHNRMADILKTAQHIFPPKREEKNPLKQ